MDEADAAQFEEGDFEVLDECIDDEESAVVKVNESVVKEKTDVSPLETASVENNAEVEILATDAKVDSSSHEEDGSAIVLKLEEDDKDNNEYESTSVVKITESTAPIDDSAIAADDSVTKIDDSVTKIDDSVTKIDDSVTKIDDSVTKIDDSVSKIDDSVPKIDNSVLVTDDFVAVTDDSVTVTDDSVIAKDESIAATDDPMVAEDSKENKSATKQEEEKNKEDEVHAEYEHLDMLGKSSIDFTADVSMDREETPKAYMTDEEILTHLDEIENIVLDGSGFELQDEGEGTDGDEAAAKSASVKRDVEKTKPKEAPNEEVEPKSTSDVTPEVPDALSTEAKNVALNDDWYDKKIDTKVTMVKERLSKLARVLEFSYPRYKGWLDRNEALTGTPVCKLDGPRRCPLDKPHTNRWKFICNRKPVQRSATKIKEENADKNVPTAWQLTPTGVWGADTDNASEYPPFVMRAVKVFEDFLRTTQPDNEESTPVGTAPMEPSVENADTKEQQPEATASDEKDQPGQHSALKWLWLLVRCNRVDELMLFATGKNIDRTTMDRLKHVYESGPGKDCNVKSLYCKSIVKVGTTPTTTTTFLVGSEALDEVVGGIKIQLAPKTNFWSNAAGAESLGNAVADLLAPTPKTTVVEVGCGTGLIGLMLASRCQKVIGLDSPSEVEEAEMTSELNGVKNASFVMGQPAEVMATIAKVLSNCKAAAIVNTNTNIGRANVVMTGLRKIFSLRRLVMVTTLTKQSVRSILELARPADDGLGNPFIPIRACVVDTLPNGPHFEVVILMERRMMHKFPHHWVQKNLPAPQSNASTQQPPQPAAPVQPPLAATVQNFTNMTKKEKMNLNRGEKFQPVPAPKVETMVKKPMDKFVPLPKRPKPMAANKTIQTPKKMYLPLQKNKFRGKRIHSPDRPQVPPKKIATRFEKANFKPWGASGKFSPEQRPREDKRPPLPMRRRNQNRNRSPLLVKDLPEKRKRSWSEESAVPRGSPLREKKFREPKDQSDLRVRLSGSRIEPDILEKVKKQQIMLDMAKQKLSGPSPTVDVATAKHLQNMLSMVLEQTNKLQSQLPRSVWDRIAPAENVQHVSPLADVPQLNDPLLKGRYVQEMGAQDILITTANREFMQPNESAPRGSYDRFNAMPPPRSGLMPPIAKQEASRFQNPMPDRYHAANLYHKLPEQGNQWGRDKMPEKNRWIDLPKKTATPPRHHMSPLRRTSPRRPASPPRRPLSPSLRRQISPSRRQMSPIRRLMSPPRRQISPPRRHMSPPRRGMSPPRRQMSPQRHHQLSPPRHQISPPRRIADEWDIPSRGAVEENTWQRPAVAEKRWHEDRQPPGPSNWDHSANNERYRKPINQDKWDIKDSSHDGVWTGGAGAAGDVWNPKQSPAAATAPSKEHWPSASENRWQNTSGGANGDNWNIRGKESFAKPNPREDPWADSGKGRWDPAPAKDPWGQNDKEDWNDLPDDAKDPWGDDGNNGTKDRWNKYDNPGSSSWGRDKPGDLWAKSGDNWQGKPQWQPTGNQPMNDSRWNPSNDAPKKGQSAAGGWQGSGNANSWQPQNYSGFQQPRSYNNAFKDRR